MIWSRDKIIEWFDLVIKSLKFNIQRLFLAIETPIFVQNRHKIETKLSTLKINLSDEKHQMLADFCKHVPFPHSDSTICLIDSIDGHIEPVSLMVGFILNESLKI